MTCHFVYAVPYGGFSNKVKRKLMRRAQGVGLSASSIGSRTSPDMTWWPKRSPYENTKKIFERLSSRLPTRLYDLSEQVYCPLKSSDIFIGHPLFPHVPGQKGVTERTLEQSFKPKTVALISPIHCDVTIQTTHINREYMEDIDRILSKADLLFAIMGPYWVDQWPSSPFAHWIPKMVPLDMAIDTTYFPRIKRQFNVQGQRKFLYIGQNDPMKGTDFLVQLAKRLKPDTVGWIGDGPAIEGVNHLSSGRALTPQFMSQIADSFDIFISTSRADPNPTTILESMAWGFPVCCTPQSGYYETEYRKNIFRDDIDRSIDILEALQSADSNILMAMADQAREVVVQKYTWGRFVTTICKGLKID